MDDDLHDDLQDAISAAVDLVEHVRSADVLTPAHTEIIAENRVAAWRANAPEACETFFDAVSGGLWMDARIAMDGIGPGVTLDADVVRAATSRLRAAQHTPSLAVALQSGTNIKAVDLPAAGSGIALEKADRIGTEICSAAHVALLRDRAMGARAADELPCGGESAAESERVAALVSRLITHVIAAKLPDAARSQTNVRHQTPADDDNHAPPGRVATVTDTRLASLPPGLAAAVRAENKLRAAQIGAIVVGPLYLAAAAEACERLWRIWSQPSNTQHGALTHDPELRERLAAGDLALVSRRLAEAESSIVSHMRTDLSRAHDLGPVAAGLRLDRGLLAVAGGDADAAARHFALGQRHLLRNGSVLVGELHAREVEMRRLAAWRYRDVQYRDQSIACARSLVERCPAAPAEQDLRRAKLALTRALIDRGVQCDVRQDLEEALGTCSRISSTSLEDHAILMLEALTAHRHLALLGHDESRFNACIERARSERAKLGTSSPPSDMLATIVAALNLEEVIAVCGLVLVSEDQALMELVAGHCDTVASIEPLNLGPLALTRLPSAAVATTRLRVRRALAPEPSAANARQACLDAAAETIKLHGAIISPIELALMEFDIARLKARIALDAQDPKLAIEALDLRDNALLVLRLAEHPFVETVDDG